MAAARTTPSVDSVVFRIDQEMTYTVDTSSDYGVQKVDVHVLPPEWTNGDTTKALKVQSGNFNPTAQVTAIAGDPDQLDRWRIGFCQNLLAFGRVATYAPPSKGVTIQQRSIGAIGTPIRDGESNEFPFGPNPGQGFALNVTVAVDPKLESAIDGPGGTYISHLGTQNHDIGLRGPLIATGGTDTFATWLVLARMPGANYDPDHPGTPTNPDRPCIILVNRLDWSATYTSAPGRGGAWSSPPPIASNLPVQQLPLGPIYTRGNPPNYQNMPDLRMNATANEQYYEEVSVSNANPQVRLQWHDTGDADPEPGLPTNVVHDVPNFLPDQ